MKRRGRQRGRIQIISRGMRRGRTGERAQEGKGKGEWEGVV